jgi:hypothetical protein
MVDFVTHSRADITEQMTHLVEVPVVRSYCRGDTEQVAGQAILSAFVRGECRCGSQPESVAGTAFASSSASRNASVIPCVVIGSLKWPASPTSAQPFPQLPHKEAGSTILKSFFSVGRPN